MSNELRLRAALIRLMSVAHNRDAKADATFEARVALGGYCGRCEFTPEGSLTEACGRKDCTYEETRDYTPFHCTIQGCSGHVLKPGPRLEQRARWEHYWDDVPPKITLRQYHTYEA